jgi:hypothetical protein
MLFDKQQQKTRCRRYELNNGLSPSFLGLETIFGVDLVEAIMTVAADWFKSEKYNC